MIKFEGQVSGQTLNYILNQHRRRSFISASIVAAVLSIVIVVVAVLYSMVFLIGLAFPAIFVAISIVAKPSKNMYSSISPQRVYIEGETLVTEYESFSFSRTIQQVEAVIDFGEGYYIKFYPSYKCPHFVCQKSLLVNGTLEDFEKLLVGKIVREI